MEGRVPMHGRVPRLGSLLDHALDPLLDPLKTRAGRHANSKGGRKEIQNNKFEPVATINSKSNI